MHVLIVESDHELGRVWERHLQRFGATVSLVASENVAIEQLDAELVDAIVLDLSLTRGSPVAIADYARYRRPDAKVISITSTSFFSDGSIFNLFPNAFAFLPRRTSPEDLTAIVAHHCGA